MGTDLKFEFKINLPPVRHKSRSYHMTKIANEPMLRQYLVLAYQIQRQRPIPVVALSGILRCRACITTHYGRAMYPSDSYSLLSRVVHGGQHRARTCDPYHVKVVL